MGRFLCHDVLFDTDAGLQGNNLFVYCGNNPVCRIDNSGADSTQLEDLDLTDDEIRLYGSVGLRNLSIPTDATQYPSFWNSLSKTVDLMLQSFNDGLGGLMGEFRFQPSTDATFVPSDYYTSKKAPPYYTPNSLYTNWKFNDHTQTYEYSTAYYGVNGQQTLRIDWTNHGRADHYNPHVHFSLFDSAHPMGLEIKK